MSVGKIVKSTLSLTCPRCHEGKVLKSSPYDFKNLGEVNTHCSHCGLKYSREPGFFFGAAYVSYAITIAFATAVVVLGALAKYLLWAEITWYQILAAVVIVLVLLFPLAYALSRVLWINFFVKYDPEKRGEN